MTTESIPTLVEPGWLAARLGAPDLRVVECTVDLQFDPETGERRSISGRSKWEQARIPRSRFGDIIEELSAASPAFPYEQPTPERFAEALGTLGIDADSRVVLYDRKANQWAARVWWLCRACGFDRVGILDGGWTQWCRQGYPIEAGDQSQPIEPTTFTPRPRTGWFVDRDTVEGAIDDDRTVVINALRPIDHAGLGVVKYDRPGRITGSVNLPAKGVGGIVDLETQRFRERATIETAFAEVGATDADRVITYCGGGIAASCLAFAAKRAGIENVAVYDGSLSEWGPAGLPMETG